MNQPTKLISERITRLKAFLLDVDGVLTDGSLFIDAEGRETKRFHIHDGYGLKQLQSQGITLAIISGRQSASLTHRMRELNVQHVYHGVAEKINTYHEFKQKLKLEDHEIAYMGDDLPDLAVMQQVGLAIAPQNAVYAIKRQAHWVTDRCGGNAAVREVCDFMRYTLTKQYKKATT